MRRYESVLVPGGEIHFKTDNRKLFEYSLVSMSAYGMTLLDVALDLHADMPEENIMTEYEEKFSKKANRYTGWNQNLLRYNRYCFVNSSNTYRHKVAEM